MKYMEIVQKFHCPERKAQPNYDELIEVEVYDAVPVADPVEVLSKKLRAWAYVQARKREHAYEGKDQVDLAQWLIDGGWINEEKLKETL